MSMDVVFAENLASPSRARNMSYIQMVAKMGYRPSS